MKKSVVLILLISISSVLYAQENNNNAIGLRFGINDGLGVEITYQRTLLNTNRLEANLGWRNGSATSGFKLTGLYQWVWEIESNFNWYAGIGSGIASYTYEKNNKNTTFFIVAGDVGIEYNFDFPLRLSLDVRPEIGLGTDENGFDAFLGLSARYVF